MLISKFAFAFSQASAQRHFSTGLKQLDFEIGRVLCMYLMYLHFFMLFLKTSLKETYSSHMNFSDRITIYSIFFFNEKEKE